MVPTPARNMIRVFYGSYLLLNHFHMFISPNIMTEQEGEDYLVTRTIKAFEYENTRSNFKCCNY